MLLLAPQQIEGVTLYPDSHDPGKWYYLPLQPRWSLQNEVPQVQLIKYAGTASQGGLLTFTVDLAIDGARLARIQRQLGAVQLVPPPWVQGTVEVTILDQTYSQHQPSLLGDNQLVFSVQLAPKEVPLLEELLFAGEEAALLIAYTLDYLALRPTYRFQLHAEWSKVQTYIEDRFRLNLVVLAVDISQVVQELVDNRLVEIRLDSFVPDGEATSERNRALQELQEMVLSAFFTAKLKPIAAPDQSGGLPAFLPGFGYHHLDITQIEKRTLNLTVSEETVVQRRVFPQAVLPGLRRSIDTTERRAFVQLIDTDHPFYRLRRVTVACRADFATDALLAVQVTLQYGDNKQMLVFRSATTQDVTWNSLNTDGGTQRAVKVSYTLQFKAGTGETRPLTLQSAEKVTLLDYLEITPRELYTIYPIPIVTPATFPWQRYPIIWVKTRYVDEVNQIQLQGLFTLKQETPEQMWALFVQPHEQPSLQYQLTYEAADGLQNASQPWRQADTQILITDPFPQRRTLELISLIDWSTVREVLIELNYQDTLNNIDERQLLTFDRTGAAQQTFQASLKDQTQQLVVYAVTIRYLNGNTRQLPASTTRAKRLFLTNAMLAHQVVKVSAAAVDFSAHQLQAIRVRLLYAEAATGAQTAQSFTFDSPDDFAYFEFDYERQKAYRCSVTYLYTTGAWASVEENAGDAEFNLVGRSAYSLLRQPIQIVPNGIDWAQIQRITLKLRYTHQDERLEEKEVIFDADDCAAQSWDFERDAQDKDVYTWQMMVTMKNRYYGKVFLPGPNKEHWEATRMEQFIITDYLPSYEMLAHDKALLLVKLSAVAVDWQVVEQIKVWLKYDRKTEQYTFAANEQPEQLFLAPLAGDKAQPLKEYAWQALFTLAERAGGKRAKVYYPEPTRQAWAESNQGQITLNTFLTSRTV